MRKRIVCTVQLPFGACAESASIVAVGVSLNGDRYENERLMVDEVYRQSSQGIVFYVLGETSRKIAVVHSFLCPRCGRRHIRTGADAVWDNNLDSLRYCRWKKAA